MAYKVTDAAANTTLSVEELIAKGYRRVSNAYCEVSRIDRDNWLEVLAKGMNCAVANYYNLNGSGVSDMWRDHYIRVYSKDTLCVGPSKIRFIPSYW